MGNDAASDRLGWGACRRRSWSESWLPEVVSRTDYGSFVAMLRGMVANAVQRARAKGRAVLGSPPLPQLLGAAPAATAFAGSASHCKGSAAN
jgi:hypothetical protein